MEFSCMYVIILCFVLLKLLFYCRHIVYSTWSLRSPLSQVAFLGYRVDIYSAGSLNILSTYAGYSSGSSGYPSSNLTSRVFQVLFCFSSCQGPHPWLLLAKPHSTAELILSCPSSDVSSATHCIILSQLLFHIAFRFLLHSNPLIYRVALGLMRLHRST